MTQGGTVLDRKQDKFVKCQDPLCGKVGGLGWTGGAAAASRGGGCVGCVWVGGWCVCVGGRGGGGGGHSTHWVRQQGR